jgi:flagellar M-ring protein FliF
MAGNFVQRLQGESQKLLQSLSLTQKLLFGSLTAATLAALVAVAIWAQQPSWATLYAGLNDKDAGAIVEQLKESRTPYELQAFKGGTAVRVPADSVHDLRLQMASQGLPREGGVVGFELFDKDTMGLTSNLFDLNYQRALEGELSRTIMQVESVERARVHLAIPKKQIFSELAEDATASITLRLKPNMALAPEQVQGIAKMVAGSVPGLDPKNVTITDSLGNVLSDADLLAAQNPAPGKFTDQQLAYQRTLEKQIRQDVERMLGRVVGRENVNVQVKVEPDFNLEETVSKSYTPNANQTAQDIKALRSERVTREAGAGKVPTPGGVPGVSTNMPSYQQIPVDNANSNFNHEDVVRNYEVPEVQTKTVKTPGSIRRMTLSVAINSVAPAIDAGPDGLEADDPKLQNLRDLAITAAGVDLTRGDKVAVHTVLFDDTALKAEAAALNKAEQSDLVRSLALYGLLALAVVVLGGLIYLAFGRRREIEPEEELDTHFLPEPEPERTMEDSPMLQELQEAASQRAVAVKSLSQMAKEDPAQMARLLRAWMTEGT